jgi:hypothetical protein
MAHPEIALDGALRERLRQAVETTPDVSGAPLQIEWTSVVAPPTSTTRTLPRPATDAFALRQSRAPSSTAAGVGISTLSKEPAARSMPLA